MIAVAAQQRFNYGERAEKAVHDLLYSIDQKIDASIVEHCASLDHSDTDNAERMRLHFGSDIVVIQQVKAKTPLFAIWTGTHWDSDHGAPRSLAIAQKLGGRILLEVEYLRPTEREQRTIDSAKSAYEVAEGEREKKHLKLIDAAEAAKEAHSKRVKRRRDFAVTSKNVSKINAALQCLAPHIMKHPDEFNADPYKVAVRNCTLIFARDMKRRKNASFIDAIATPDEPPHTTVCKEVRVEARPGHYRSDLLTQVVPVDYDKDARCPLWLDFIEKMVPDPEVRRLIQVSSGLGLLGIAPQKLFFHYGSGANGKSIYMEVICRLLGEMAVTLPATSFIGEGGSSGSASPDLVRLYGRRMLRIKELPEGEDLRENLVKEITGGEAVSARDLFAGYMDFSPKFIAMMSGNGYPKITGKDEGIWRRMAVIHWPVTIAESRRREFDELVSSFDPERPGILNWLIEGASIFLTEGLIIPDAVRRSTQEYRDAMDPTAAFCAQCVTADPEAPPLQAKNFYQAYETFTNDEGGRPISLTSFGNIMKRKFEKRDSGRGIFYHGVRLQLSPSHSQRPTNSPGVYSDDAPFPEDF
jgi:putative DNA primase/helicase